MSSQKKAYTDAKSHHEMLASMAGTSLRLQEWGRDMQALALVQASRRLVAGQASIPTWLGLYGRRKPYRAVLRNGDVVLT